MAKVKKVAKKLTAKKKWVTILAPNMFNNQVIGETCVYDAREGIGKPVTVNLMTLSRSPKAQGTNVSFIVDGQHDGKLTTSFTGLRIMPSVVRRMARRDKDKFEDSFICITSDGKKVRVKPVAVTRSKVTGSILAKMRRIMRELIATAASQSTFEKFSCDIVDRKLQKTIQDAISKVYPVLNCDIRWLILMPSDQKPAEEAKPEEKAEE